MKRKSIYIILIFVAVTAAIIFAANLHNNSIVIKDYTSIPRPAQIKPDYTDLAIPPNIAPLNFVVKDSGQQYLVKIYSVNGEPVEVFSRTGKIKISLRPWRALLNANKGQELFKKMRHISLICGPASFVKIPGYIEKIQKENTRIIDLEDSLRDEELYRSAFRIEPDHAQVIISTGCSNYCSY